MPATSTITLTITIIAIATMAAMNIAAHTSIAIRMNIATITAAVKSGDTATGTVMVIITDMAIRTAIMGTRMRLTIRRACSLHY